jgi:hypothetical protein
MKFLILFLLVPVHSFADKLPVPPVPKGQLPFVYDCLNGKSALDPSDCPPDETPKTGQLRAPIGKPSAIKPLARPSLINK